jgi:pimeloyl-ACP methyl ester carboxylesterase
MITVRDVDIDSGGRCLRGTVTERSAGPASGAAVIFVHGWGSGQAAYRSRAERVVRAVDCRCLAFDLSGHGTDAANLSRYSIHEHLDDVVSAYDYLIAQGADPARVAACGASYGAYLVALLSAQRRINRLVLRAPPLASAIKIPASEQGQSRNLDGLSVVSDFDGAVLVVESELDEVVPHSSIVAYLEASGNASHEVIPGAGHALERPEWDEMFVGFLIGWFKDL